MSNSSPTLYSYIIDDIKHGDYYKAAVKIRYEARLTKSGSKQRHVASVMTIESTLQAIHTKLLPLEEKGKSSKELAEAACRQTHEALGLESFDGEI
jgi:hypothetical protein